MGYGNFQATKLSTDIDASTNTIKVDTLPRDSAGAIITSGRIVLEARNSDKREIVRYTTVDVGTTSLTGVLRGQGNTTAKTHSKGAAAEMNITAQDLEDALSVPNTIAQFIQDGLNDFVVPGSGIITLTTGFTGSMTNIQYYINGIRFVKNGIANKVFTASRDTYVFIDINGTITYTEVANGAAAPATPANSVLVAVVVTNASTITLITNYNRGGVDSENIDGFSFFYEYWTNPSTVSAPGEFNWTTVKTFDVSSLPDGAVFEVDAGTSGYDGSGSGRTSGISIQYNGLGRSIRQLNGYHWACQNSIKFRKVPGVNTGIIQFGGNNNLGAGALVATISRVA